MTRCPDECGKKWKTERQTKPGWKKQEEREEKERRKPTIEEEKMIVRLVEEKEEEEEDLIEISTTEDMVPRRFHKYLKVFEKKDSERMLTRKTWDHAIDLREGFVPKKGEDISIVESRKRGSTGVCGRSAEEGVYQAIEVTTDVTSVLCAKERWEEENSAGLSIPEQLDN